MKALHVNSDNVSDVTGKPLDSAAMTLGVRIEERLAAIGISQSELARRVGVRQSTINSLIRGDNRTSRSLIKIARELRTSAAYLTGDSDDPDHEGPTEVSLGSEERDLLSNFGHLSAADRKALLQIARSMAGGAHPSETVHAGGVNPDAAASAGDDADRPGERT